MSRWTLEPGGPLCGTLHVPGDKSISHRALLLNLLASGPARIQGLLDSEDVAATARAVRALGATLVPDDGGLVLTPPTSLLEPDDVIDCGNSGTTTRLLAGLVAAEDVSVVLTGDASLRRRPMARITRPLRTAGVQVVGRDGGGRLPLAVRGPATHRVAHDLPIASAQVKSSMLLAGRRTGVAVREPRQSRDHTERMLGAMGAPLVVRDGWLHLDPVVTLEPLSLTVPRDISAAAFWLVAGAIVPGSDIVLPGVGVNPTRTGVVDVLRAMGADLTVDGGDGAGEPVADLRIRHGGLRGVRIDGELALRALDELPVLAVAAAFAEGETVIADAAELRVKESDRVARTAALLRALHIEVEERPDGMVIQGGRPRGPACIDATGDHRIAMAAAVASAVAGPVAIDGADSVGSSYPAFPRHLEALRGS